MKLDNNKNDFGTINIRLFFILLSLVTIFFFILDSFNMFGSALIKLNVSFWQIYISSIVVIIVFVLTYHFVEKRNINRETKVLHNKREALAVLLTRAYEDSLGTIKLLSDRKIVAKYLIPKIDFDSLHNQVLSDIKTKPFENDSEILMLFIDGACGGGYMVNYLRIKKGFEKYIDMSVVFYDAKDGSETQKQLKKEEADISKMIKNEIKSINNLLSVNNL